MLESDVGAGKCLLVNQITDHPAQTKLDALSNGFIL
jgi:hypothetical protein